MRALLSVLTLVIVSANQLQAVHYEIRGQITEGSDLFLDVESIPRDPIGGFPIDYLATLKLDDERLMREFRFELTDSIGSAVHIFDFSGDDLDVSIIATSDVVRIEKEVFFWFGEEFALGAELKQNTGSWRWRNYCHFCDDDLALPYANATITSIRSVPEPASLVIALSLCFALTVKRRL